MSEATPDVSPEKLAEIQKDLTALCDKHNVDLRASQKLEISLFPREEKAPEVSALSQSEVVEDKASKKKEETK